MCTHHRQRRCPIWLAQHQPCRFLIEHNGKGPDMKHRATTAAKTSGLFGLFRQSSPAVVAAALAGAAPALAQSGPLTGSAAFGDWRTDKPGLVRLIRPADLPKPGATASSANVSHVAPRPAEAMPKVAAG